MYVYESNNGNKENQQWEVYTVFSESGGVVTLWGIVTLHKQKLQQQQHNKQQCED